MDLTGLGGYTDILTSNALQNAEKQKLDKLKSALTSARGAAEKDVEDPELLEACKKFEAYFLEQVFKEMEKTVPEHDYGDQAANSMVDFFKDNAIQSLAEQATQGQGMGLANQLYEQMKRNINPVTAADIEKAKLQEQQDQQKQ